MNNEIIIGIFNFFLLLVIIYLIVGQAARQFFYARRERTRKWVASSAWSLRKARLRLKKIKKEFDVLSDDISSRQKEIEMVGAKECHEIIKEAEMHQNHILENAGRFAQDERARAVRAIRGKLLMQAFRIAERKLSGKISTDIRKKTLARGFDALVLEFPVVMSGESGKGPM